MKLAQLTTFTRAALPTLKFPIRILSFYYIMPFQKLRFNIFVQLRQFGSATRRLITRTKMQSCTTTGIRIVDLDTLSAAMSASRSRDPKSRLHVPPYCARQHISQVLKNVWRPTRTKNFNITATETKQILPPF